MLKKFKKFMIVAAAAVMLSAGFATAAPNEAHAAHWADDHMNWAMRYGYITSDLRDSYATRQDTWLIMTRVIFERGGLDYNYARSYVINHGISDGTRGTNWVTRQEVAAMIYNNHHSDRPGFAATNAYAVKWYIFDGTRPTEPATRAEVVTMLHKAKPFWMLEPR
ncbi:protein phosphatase 2C [Bacillus toyonensis]|uniref:protein phosphatase 2C n=1 Tax=Bacillus toyonensis TaxID=155322 RepID=UPI001C029FB7|nr:protein phosphatase 2C [Bacillus toyonensis]UFI00682.1 protein phosphatase 2C [Bacillus toyonensis]